MWMRVRGDVIVMRPTQATLVYVRSKSCSQSDPSLEVSQRPAMVLRSSLKVPEKRCENSSGVRSASLREPLEWNATRLEGDLVESVQLKQQRGGNLISYGCGELAYHFGRAGSRR
jgi:hypothetical protein